MSLIFDPQAYTVETFECEDGKVTFRAFENIQYCENPKDPVFQTLSIFVPECYYAGESINGYDLHSAPIFFPNTVGGYRPGPVERPGRNHFNHEITVGFYALLHGYVVMSAGARGNGSQSADGENIGFAPAGLVDLKAAIRYVKANAALIPGDASKIITDGTSAGGAMSSLLGSTGNHPDYQPYLKEMGAADSDDSVFAAACYCPITNLDHADMAYEWEFGREKEYHSMRFIPPAGPGQPPKFLPDNGTMAEEKQAMIAPLASAFADYVNGLNLTDANGVKMAINADGTGTFADHMAEKIRFSADKELQRLAEGRPGDGIVNEKYEGIRHRAENTHQSPAEADGITITDGKVTAVDLFAFVHFRTRMKQTPAFDNVDMGTPENQLFGCKEIRERHFNAFSADQAAAAGKPADQAPAEQVKLMNPTYYIPDPKAVKAKHFRIRHGAVDRDTSLAISELLELMLQKEGIDAETQHPWGINHNGDYDLTELFAWMDSICK